MHWVYMVLVAVVHMQTMDYQYNAPGPQTVPHQTPQWMRSVMFILVHMLWYIGAQLRKFSNDMHPLPGTPPPFAQSVCFVILNVGGPFLSRRRWGRLLQEVTAHEPTIVGLQQFRFGTKDNHMAWTASMSKNCPLSHKNHNLDTMFLIHERVHMYVKYHDTTPIEKVPGWLSTSHFLTCPPLVIINVHGPFEKAQ